jgi:hypothetical protein
MYFCVLVVMCNFLSGHHSTSAVICSRHSGMAYLLLTRVVVNIGGGVTGSCGGAGPQSLLDPFFARMVWREMLQAVDHIHAHRIVHGEYL